MKIRKKKLFQIRFAKRKHIKELRRIHIRKEKKITKLDEIRKKEIKEIKRTTCKSTKPPSNFSFINNPEELVKYFSDNKQFSNNWYGIDFDLTDIEELTFDSIALLLATIKDPHYRNWVEAMGQPPKKEALKALFEATWFYGHVYSHTNIKEGEINGKMIKNSYTKKVVSTLAKEITHDITSETLPWMFPGNRCKPLYNTIIECMANTENHAGFRDENKYNWWVFYYKHPETHITQVCFIDLGTWIIKSMQAKWKDWISDAFDWLGLLNNAQKLLKILDWKILIPSRTWEKKRWKWLKQFNNFYQKEFVENFTIISNDIYLNLNKNITKKLDNSFGWTFLYWEIHPIN